MLNSSILPAILITLSAVMLASTSAAFGDNEVVFKGYGSDLAYSSEVAFSMARTKAINDAYRQAEAAGYRVVRTEDSVFYQGKRKGKEFCEGWVHAYCVRRTTSTGNSNVHRNSNGKLSPDAGYGWVAPDAPNDLRTRWEPGKRHPTIKGIYASGQENRWSLYRNYHWLYPGTNKLDTYYHDPSNDISLPPAITYEDVHAGTTNDLGTIYTRGSVARLICSDHGSEDGDRVEILRNGVTVYSNVVLSNRPIAYNIALSPGRNEITFRALNEGSSSPNTARFITRGEDWKLLSKEKQWSLSTGESARIVVVRQ